MYKVLSAESCSGGDTQPATASVAANQKSPSKKSRPPSASLLYPVVNSEVEQEKPVFLLL
jgi:hypothetical protein